MLVSSGGWAGRVGRRGEAVVGSLRVVIIDKEVEGVASVASAAERVAAVRPAGQGGAREAGTVYREGEAGGGAKAWRGRREVGVVEPRARPEAAGAGRWRVDGRGGEGGGRRLR
jgi:hypothetical protein